LCWLYLHLAVLIDVDVMNWVPFVNRLPFVTLS
jgi:hypothetical protein